MPDVIYNKPAHRLEIQEGEKYPYMNLRVEKEEILVILHTEVPLASQGKGYGSLLIRHAIAMAQDKRWRIVAICPYAQAWLKRHEEFAHLVLPWDALKQ